MPRKLLILGAVLSAFGQSSWAQEGRVSIDAALHTSEKPYIQATGKAAVSAKPDEALVEIGVVSQGSTAAAASEQNARHTDAVLADLGSFLDTTGKLKTTSYSLRPTYQSPKPGAAAAITGYTATNVIEVTLEDLSKVSKVIDRSTQSGANVIQKLQYRLKNPNTIRAQALRAAAEEAKASAEAIASGLGLKIVRVLSAEEEGSDDSFVMSKKAPVAFGGPAPATPLEAGTIEVQVGVIVRVEIGQ